MKLMRRILSFSVLWIAVSTAALVAQVNPLVDLLAQDGWKALAAGQAAAAAKIFQQALAIDANNPELHLGAGTAAYLDRRDEAAQTALERALQLNPALPRARELLGLVQYRRGDLFGAIRTYELIDRSQSQNQQASERLERWRDELDLHNRMNTVVSSAFTVSFEGETNAELAALAMASLERAVERIGQVLSTYPDKQIPVVLYTTEQFRDITLAPMWAGGAYDGTIRVPMRGALANPQELDRVLAHEYTHALIHTLALRNVPTWLNEGLATALEKDSQIDAQSRSQPLPRGVLAALQTSFGRFTGEQAKLAYDVSARASRQLLDEAGGFAVANLLRDLGQGVKFDEAFLHRMPWSFESFESTLSSPR
jgi:tetratricopeptide (TPR) repeat protein